MKSLLTLEGGRLFFKALAKFILKIPYLQVGYWGKVLAVGSEED
jgi:hypothetical protein